MKNYTYQNDLIGKKQLRQLLAWSFTNYDSMQACSLADELKYLGFKYATQAGISISIEDLKVPFVKNLILEKANQEIINAEKLYLKGKITDVERFQKIIDTWSLTSESLKDQIIYYFKNYDPLNSVYIMAFSGARGNLSQVRQLVGMRGLMSDPSGQIMNLPIKKNFREGLTITDYLMSGYGARKGIVDTALKTANSGYLTRRLIDVSQDILIREKDCRTNHSFSVSFQTEAASHENLIGRILNKPVLDCKTQTMIANANVQITPKLLRTFQEKDVDRVYIRSPLTCKLYRAICQQCYGWDLSTENLVDIGEAIGILAGQSIGEPGTQLTMRTFHTGGIFTSEAREQIISPCSGIIQFYKLLKTVVLRTNRGEDVLVTKNSGSLILIPDQKDQNLVQIEVLRNTILFPKNNQYILRDTVIGELINTNKQIKTEVKAILADQPGEVFVPKLKQKVNVLNNNKLIWILFGQLYNSPSNSFLNFYPDYKVNRQSYIFRTKLVNPFSGYIEFVNREKSLSQRTIQIIHNKTSFNNSSLALLNKKVNLNNALFTLDSSRYFVTLEPKRLKNFLQLTRNEKIGTLVTNVFHTLTGGTIFYHYENLRKPHPKNEAIVYFELIHDPELYDQDYNDEFYNQKQESTITHRTAVWLGEEIHKVKCDSDTLLVEHGDFISEGFELIPDLFSKTSGVISIQQKNTTVTTISVKSGMVYEGKQFKQTARKVYYPGEVICSNIVIQSPSFCEYLGGKKLDQLLIRPIELYEFSHLTPLKKESSSESNLTLHSLYSYKSNQTIKGVKTFSLVSKFLTFETNKLVSHNLNLEVINNPKKQAIELKVIEKLLLTNYIFSQLKYTNLQSCFLVQPQQFISNYATLGYLEAITNRALEIVKLKVKKQQSKQILLISNDNCAVVPKEQLPTKKLHDFVLETENISTTGRIIIENDKFVTIQKGRPYFFPNCKTEEGVLQTNLQYKFVSSKRFPSSLTTKRNISLNYYDAIQLSVQKKLNVNQLSSINRSEKFEFSKLFLKNNGKLYSCLMPQFVKKFTIKQNESTLKFQNLLRTAPFTGLGPKRKARTVLLQSSGLVQNPMKDNNEENYQLALLGFVAQPLTKSTKAVGLYAITEDYFEQEANSVFCKNSEFIETGKTIGLLNLEKEITGDIVQGLPRIEEILEARKKNAGTKRIPTSQKKGLLIQKTTLDPSFEFKKVGTTVKENDKVNPHKLLKVYFNYYGVMKFFFCDRKKSIHYNRFTTNAEGSYKSFKKVQTFILNSVQAVYQSQGVTINNKHLEVIVKQMTTKVLVTYEGDTPLLRREVIDLYHMQYINEILEAQSKQSASYVPLLLGITKAALNNPSFISAASFQETTRVLTKAAIEGRMDWLRGLKENIIVGHLIPAGTGSPDYRHCFKKPVKNPLTLQTTFENIQNVEANPRQVF
jgi:DNA-directed RNA polymerase subunit beta'